MKKAKKPAIHEESSVLKCSPAELFDLYIEVGEIKVSEIQAENSIFIEVWVSSTWKSRCIRPECRSSVRRPIYGVIQEIAELCAEKNACVMIMEDDAEDAVQSWERAIFLMTKHLKRIKNIKAVIPYTKQTNEEINKQNIPAFYYDFDKECYITLYDIADAYITQQSNIYSDASKRKVFINNKRVSAYVSKLLHG